MYRFSVPACRICQSNLKNFTGYLNLFSFSVKKCSTCHAGRSHIIVWGKVYNRELRHPPLQQVSSLPGLTVYFPLWETAMILSLEKFAVQQNYYGKIH